MAHLILENDKQEGRVQAWHGLTVINPDLNLRDCWLAKHDVSPLAVYAGGEEITLPDGRKAVVGAIPTNQRILNSDGAIIGGSYDPETYTPIRNADILETIGNSLEGVKYTVIGFMSRYVIEQGTHYPWTEYLLYNPQKGFPGLICNKNN